MLAEICNYFSRPVANRQKGILLSGSIGVGKSEIMFGFFQAIHILAANPQLEHFKQHRFAFKTAKNAAAAYQQQGYSGMDFYTRHFNSSTPPRLNHMLIDDIGTEINKKFFGNEANVVGEIIGERYDRYKSGLITHFTTNLNPEQLREMYGDRTVDRLIEMSYMIEITGESRRK